MAKPAAIRPLSETARIRMALVTASGYGKTVFAGTAPRALFLTTDPEGTVSAKKWGSTAEEWPIESWDDKDGLEDAYNYMQREGYKEFDWLIHDNATEEQQLCMGKSIANRMKRRPDGEKYVPEQADYQKSQNGFIDVTKRFLKIPVHQIWTVHRKAMETDDGVNFWSANIQGQQGAIAEQFLGYMNVIGMGEVIEKDAKHIRRLYFDHIREYRGKDRFQALGKFRDDLDIPSMMKIIEGGGKVSTGATAKKTVASRRRRTA